jgi:hypothetical protein
MHAARDGNLFSGGVRNRRKEVKLNKTIRKNMVLN